MDVDDPLDFDMRGANAILLMGPEERAEFEGRFWAMTRVQVDVWRVGLTPDELCLEWTGATRDGYGAVRIRGILSGAHAAAWVLANGRPIPRGWVIRHLRCNNPLCVRADHLAIGTPADNARDKAAWGRSKPEWRSRWSKLSAEDDKTIYELRQGGETVAGLARFYDVTRAAIKAAYRRRAKRLAAGPPEWAPEPPGSGEAGKD